MDTLGENDDQARRVVKERVDSRKELRQAIGDLPVLSKSLLEIVELLMKNKQYKRAEELLVFVRKLNDSYERIDNAATVIEQEFLK